MTDECITDLPGEEDADPLIRRRIARYLYEHRQSGDILLCSYPGEEEGYTVLDLGSATELYREEAPLLKKIDETLVRIWKETTEVGHILNSVDNRWVVPTLNNTESLSIIDELAREGYLRTHHGKPSDLADWYVSLTPAGMRRSEELERSQHVVQKATVVLSNGQQPRKVFLCHSHKDESFAERLANDLHRRGIDVWYDGWDLDIGHDLTVKIQEGIQESEFLAVILSPAAVESAWVEKEWTTAFNRELEERKVVVLPILYQDCDMPPFLKGKRYADFRKVEDYEAELADLIRCLKGESKRPPRRGEES